MKLGQQPKRNHWQVIVRGGMIKHIYIRLRLKMGVREFSS